MIRSNRCSARNYKTKKKRNKFQSGRPEKAGFGEFKRRGNINPGLRRASWELKFEMFWASIDMEIEDLLRNNNEDFKCGFQQGWGMCTQVDVEVQKILEQDGDSTEFET